MDLAAAWKILASVMDPEVPQISVVDLGVVRDIRITSDASAIEVDLTPTYSGCPATEVIEQSVADALKPHFSSVTINTRLKPAWSTDWMTAQGRENLRTAGIAPPPTSEQRKQTSPTSTMRTIATLGEATDTPHCPRCSGEDVEKISQFGSTACKSLWRCRGCLEPFDYFKGF